MFLIISFKKVLFSNWPTFVLFSRNGIVLINQTISQYSLMKCDFKFMEGILSEALNDHICIDIFEHSSTIKIIAERVNQEKRLVEFAGYITLTGNQH